MREWEMEIPADHAVASVTGAQVADYAVASEIKDGKRTLKIIFKQAVSDRQLVSVRLEKNEAAKAGPWELQPLGFPGVKSRRGYIGAVAAAGYRLTAGKTTGVAEVPVTFFPKKTNGLQQAFRLREDKWTVGSNGRGARSKHPGGRVSSLLAQGRRGLWQRVDELLRRRLARDRMEDLGAGRHRQHRRHRPERRPRLAA